MKYIRVLPAELSTPSTEIPPPDHGTAVPAGGGGFPSAQPPNCDVSASIQSGTDVDGCGAQSDAQPKRKASTRQIFTYFIQGNRGGPIKIGKAFDALKRVKELQTGYPYPLVILLVLEGDQEKELHSTFAETRANGEWFEPSPLLLKFITDRMGESAKTGMGGLNSTPPPKQHLPLMLRYLFRKYEADEWLETADYEDEDERDLDVPNAIADFHKSACGIELFACSAADELRGDSQPSDEDEAESWEACREGTCECDELMSRNGIAKLLTVPLHGLLLRKRDLAIIAVIQWPHAHGLQEAIQHAMESAAFYLDFAEFQLHAVLVNPDYSYSEVSMGDIFGGRLIAPRQDVTQFAIDSILGFSSIVPLPLSLAQPDPAKGGQS